MFSQHASHAWNEAIIILLISSAWLPQATYISAAGRIWCFGCGLADDSLSLSRTAKSVTRFEAGPLYFILKCSNAWHLYNYASIISHAGGIMGIALLYKMLLACYWYCNIMRHLPLLLIGGFLWRSVYTNLLQSIYIHCEEVLLFSHYNYYFLW